MNTLPQTFDERPLARAGQALAATAAAPAARRRPDAHLKLVVDHPVANPALAEPYGLNGRRHLASVPARHDAAAVPAQAAAAGADNPGMARAWQGRHLEPLAFALVLLVSVAALAVATRAA